MSTLNPELFQTGFQGLRQGHFWTKNMHAQPGRVLRLKRAKFSIGIAALSEILIVVPADTKIDVTREAAWFQVFGELQSAAPSHHVGLSRQNKDWFDYFRRFHFLIAGVTMMCSVDIL